MAFIERVKELRKKLIVSLVGLLIAAAVYCVVYDPKILILCKPFEALENLVEDKVLFVNTIFDGFLIKIRVTLLTGVIISMSWYLYRCYDL